MQRQKQDKLGRTGIHILTCRVTVAQQMHLSPGSSHGSANGGAVGVGILIPHGDVIQIEDLAGDLGGDGTVRQALGVHIQLTHHIQQAAAGPCFDGLSVDPKFHNVTSFRTLHNYGLLI